MPDSTEAETTQDWTRIDALLDRALELPPAQRAALVARECGDDAALAAEVNSLLAAMEDSEGFLDGQASDGLGGADSPPVPGGAAVGSVLRDWRLTRLIGRGGMGEVYEAERADGQFRQRAAIKLIRSDIAVSAPRFLLERQIVATLQHPGIARLLDGGMTPDGRPFMVMELIEGQGLRSYCQTARLDLRARVELVQRIAEAVSFAHRNLVVHRDLKPANVLIDGEGQVKLLDFGIAKLMDADEEGAARTQTLVTPDAAAPELLRGGAVTAATDVYGLGLILYELLTGEPPYDLGTKPLALALQQVLDRELPPPSQRGRLFPEALLRGDLDAIALKALRHDPLQRYATAEALLDDLRRWRAGEPVLARGDGGWYLMSRYIRRHRLVFAAGGALLLSLALGSAGIAWQAREAAVQRDQALAAAQRTKAISDYVMHMFRVADDEKRGGETVSARTVLEKAASRVRQEFANDPAAARDTLLAVGDLYFQLGDYPGAEAALGQFLELVDASTDPNAVATAKHRLAEIRFQPGQPQVALQLLSEAQALWGRDPGRYRDAIENSHILEAAFAREAGNVERSVALLEPIAAAAREGADPEYAAVLLNELGSSYTEAGRFADAQASYREALQRFEALGQGESSNAAIALNNLCGSLHLAGEEAEAADCARRSASLRDRLYGPSANSAAVRLLLGQILIAREDLPGALQELEQGLVTAQEFVGADSGMVQRLRLAKAQALIEAGRAADAQAQIAEVTAVLARTPDLGLHFQGLILVEQARLALHRQQLEQARALLDQAAPLVRAPHGNRRDDLATLERLQAQIVRRQTG